MTDSPWHGCHGVRVAGDIDGLGAASGEPLADATVRVAVIDDAGGRQLWSQRGETLTADGVVTVERALYRESPTRLVVRSSRGPALAVDTDTATITVEPSDVWLQRQLVAAFGLPLLLGDGPVLLLHASACTRGRETVVFCGPSGVGKSTALVGHMDDGWAAVTEDLCALDLRGDAPAIWPGPPWVRLRNGQPGPRGASAAFTAADKTGWDTGANHAREPRPVTRIVVMQPTGEARGEALSAPQAIAALAAHTTWLGEPAERGRACFGALARVAATVPVVCVRSAAGGCAAGSAASRLDAG